MKSHCCSRSSTAILLSQVTTELSSVSTAFSGGTGGGGGGGVDVDDVECGEIPAVSCCARGDEPLN
jgi:hypothetical protein